MYLGWIASGRWMLPVHQPVEPHDFVCCERHKACQATLATPICGVCSYDVRTGQPSRPVPFPCLAYAVPARPILSLDLPTPREPIGKVKPRARPGQMLNKPNIAYILEQRDAAERQW